MIREALVRRYETLGAPQRLGLDPAMELRASELFRRPFVMLHLISEVYAARVALALALDLGWEARLRAGARLEALVEGLAPQSREPARWMLGFMAQEGLLEAQGAQYRLVGSPDLDLRGLRELAETEAPGHLANLDLFDALRRRIPPFFTEGRRGEDLLFGLELFPLWLQYFRNANMLYRANNFLALAALAPALRPGARILELGGGAGSFAQTVAAEGSHDLAEYRFTDVAPAFLRRAQRTLPEEAPGLPFTFGSLDVNRPLDGQGLSGMRFDGIVGINVLHVARDLPAALADLRAHLAPGGRLVLGECLKPALDRPIYLEFFFEFMSGFREVELVPGLRPAYGFLTPEHWAALLRHAGFREVVEVPPVRPLMDQFQGFNVGAFAALA